MIKRILILAVVRLLSAALSVGAVSVTPSSASDYIFTTPLFPDSIRGEVMGDPPAYFDPRGEDIDWLFEAFMERHALINGKMWDPWTRTKPSFGEWPLSYTNNFYTWSTAVDAAGNTNIVVGYNLVTNAPRFSLSNLDVERAYETLSYNFFRDPLGYETYNGAHSYYLDGDAPLLDGARVAHDYHDTPHFTNVNHTIRSTYHVVTNVSYIVMPMTNGTTSVFTNRWTATLYHLVTNSVTNVTAAIARDYCHAGEGPFPGFPNETGSNSGLLRGRRDGDLSVMYDALRAAVRLADETSTTNLVKYVSGSASSYEEDDGTTTVHPWSAFTNLTQTAEYSISGDHTVWSYSWNEDSHAYDIYYRVYVTEEVTEAYEAIAPTRFKSDLVTTGGVVRVEIEAAFAFVEFEYTKYLQEGTAPDYTNVLDVDIDKLVIVPLESYSLDLSHKDALARIQIDAQDLSMKAAAASGAPEPPRSAKGYVPPKSEIHEWDMECKGIVLIYRTHPSSKFTDW